MTGESIDPNEVNAEELRTVEEHVEQIQKANEARRGDSFPEPPTGDETEWSVDDHLNAIRRRDLRRR